MSQLRALIDQLRLQGMAGALDAELARAGRTQAHHRTGAAVSAAQPGSRLPPRAQPGLSPDAGAPCPWRWSLDSALRPAAEIGKTTDPDPRLGWTSCAVPTMSC